MISDEIHCDLTIPGQEYIPFAPVSESCRNNSITCIAPTKAFNLAGLYLSEGRQYGENGNSFIRMNIACPRSRLEDGLKRLVEGIRVYEEWVLANC